MATDCEKSSIICFFVNGNEQKVNNPDPELSLAYYVRNTLGLTGTKLGCEEGACGACTVVVGKYDLNVKKPIYHALNSCLVPLYMMDRCSVITVEGISKERIHPVQERLSRGHGTQCGFCSPGFTMAMYALLRNEPSPSMREINQAVKGNLCRCTGYRPILEAFYSFSSEGKKDGCCMGGSDGCPCKDENRNETKLETFHDMAPYDPTQEIIFPPKLLVEDTAAVTPLFLKGKRVTLHVPTSLEELKQLTEQEGQQFKLISSGMITRLVASMNPSPSMHQLWISLHRIPEMSTVTISGGELSIGGALSIGEFQSALKLVNYAEPLIKLLEKYSSDQVKNSASWAGALTSASATSDMCTMALALNFQVVVYNIAEASEKTLSIEELFDAPKTVLSPVDVIKAIKLPLEKPGARIFTFKQGDRRGADSTVVNMVTCVEEKDGLVSNASIVFGVDKKPTSCKQLARWLIGKHLARLVQPSSELSAFKEGIQFLNQDLSSASAAKDFEFTNSLCRAAFFDVLNQLSGTTAYHNMELHPEEFESAQVYKKSDEPLGRPLAHQYAGRHTTGEAKYINDIKVHELLHMALVLSTEEHAEILSVDPSDALTLHGVVDYVGVKDIHPNGTNLPGMCGWCILQDDTPVFADGKVESIGQIIGAIVAKDVLTARKAAQLVKIDYKKLPSIVTIQDAITAESYIVPPQIFGASAEEVEKELSKSEFIQSGQIEIGGQEHLYMETQATVVVPEEEDEYTVYSGTQNAGLALPMCAAVLGTTSNKVVVKVKRIGGAFGGKGTQCGLVRFPTCVAAQKLKKPVSCVLSRTDDMIITGKRHPVYSEYKVGFSKDGRLQAMYLKHYVDGGFSIDNSAWVTQVLGSVSTACYSVPTVRTEAYALKTNKHSNTAFRGYGQPQCYFAMEKIMCAVAAKVNMSVDEVKEINFAHVGEKLLAGHTIRNDGMLDCWNECKQFADIERVHKEVDEFNKKSEYIKRGASISTVRFAMPHPGPFEQAHALVQICLDGAVTISTGGAEMGQGINIKILQIASKALNLPMEKIHLLDLSTDKTINPPITGGSQAADVHGRAVQKCCAKLLSNLQPLMEQHNGDWDKAVFAAWLQKIPLQTSEHISLERAQYGIPESECLYFTTGAASVVAEVDCLTGEHRLVSVDIVMDCGDSLNPAIDIGQIEGGFMQGYGLLTCEELTYNGGKLLNDSAYKYKIPTAQMVPDKFRVKLIEGISNHPEQIYSSKGIGEPPLMLGSAAHTAICEAIQSYRSERGHPELQVYNAPLTAKYIQMMANTGLTKNTL